MSITFNAFEILEMAEQIERNGIKFYRKAAQQASEQNIRRMFLNLADMEAEHEEVFARMKKQLSAESRELKVFDPENEVVLYLQAMADGHVFDPQKNPAELLTGNETVQDVLKLAINAEKDSIVFYLGLKDFVAAGKDKIEAIIKAEMGHIAILNRTFAALK